MWQPALVCVLLFFSQGSPVVAGTVLDTWDLRKPLLAPYDLYGVVSGPEGFVAVGDWGCVLTSPGGKHWGDGSVDAVELLHDVSFVQGMSVAVGREGVVLLARDGQHWTRHNSGARLELFSIAFGNDRLLLSGNGVMMQSDPILNVPGELDQPVAGFRLEVEGGAESLIHVEYSSDPKTWVESVGTIHVSGSSVWLNGDFESRRFFRVKWD